MSLYITCSSRQKGWVSIQEGPCADLMRAVAAVGNALWRTCEWWYLEWDQGSTTAPHKARTPGLRVWDPHSLSKDVRWGWTPLIKTTKKIKIKLWEIKMFDGGSERGPQRGPMSDLCVLAIRTCLPHESETKSKFQLSLFWLRKRLNRITEIARILFLNFSSQHVQNRILWAQGTLWEMRLLCSSGRGAPWGVSF